MLAKKLSLISPSRRKDLGKLTLAARGCDLQLTGESREALERVVFGQAQVVVDLGRIPRSFFGSHPEFALVVAGEEGLVLLRFVVEDRQLLAEHGLGTERHGPLDF